MLLVLLAGLSYAGTGMYALMARIAHEATSVSSKRYTVKTLIHA